MKIVPVESRDIALIGYDKETLILQVAFRTGGVYQYMNVPEEVHRAFMDSSSHGIYFRDNIKKVYEHKKIK